MSVMKAIWFIPVISGYVYGLPHEPITQVAHNDALGKTHFIVGEPRAFDNAPTVSKKTVPAPSYEAHAFFSPDDDMKKELMSLIDDEKSAITIAVFLLTDQDIADALARAQKRGVVVELVTDSGCLRERYNKVGMLCDAGCAVYVYNPSYKKQDNASLMHHKFALFKNNKKGKSLVWTGSFNFTKSASNINQENVVMLEDPRVVEKFENQFAKLKERSYRYGNKKKV